MATTLTACGGGGGGPGAVSTVTNFVQDDLSSLTGSESIISSYSSLLSGFNSSISSGNIANLSAIITGPTDEDIEKAGSLLTMLDQAESLWSQTIDLIESQDSDTKLQIYNSEDYKNAHAAVLYLKNHVKPVIQKVSKGQKLSLTEYNKVASDKKAEEIIKQEKESTVETYVVDQKTKIDAEKQKKLVKKEEDTKEETKKEETKEEDTKEVVKEEKKEVVKEEKKEVVKTPGHEFRTTEFKNDTGKIMINADKAYLRGWTGKGAVLGVIDTWQDIDHPELDGKYEWYKNYTRYDDTVDNGGNTQYHGTHVAGIIAAKKDNIGTHGVAYDSNLVGANVDYYGKGMISKGSAQSALHDMAKLKSPISEGGQEMNIIAVNLSFNSPQVFTDRNGSTVTQLSDGTYNAIEITNKIDGNGYGDAKYWKVATDSDIILVNSAGNTGHDHAGEPGIWAVEKDQDGNLVLGGKMVIVGSWTGTGVSGNKAGHVCLDINTTNNTCNDTTRISDFYILAPGQDINSTVPVGLASTNYMTSSGTSMAAPHVTGAFGVLHQMWPYMKGENLVKLVMNTADKSLIGYDVNIHGQGLLDLDEATKPQGAIGIVTTGRVDHPHTILIQDTYFSTGTSLPSDLSGLKIMVLDDYDRNYYMDIGSSFVVQDNRKYSDVELLVNNQNNFLPQNQMYGLFSQGGQWQLDKNYHFGLYTGENGNGDYSVNAGKDIFITDKFKLKTSLSHMSEQETWLGNSSDGALAVGDNNDTNSANIGIDYQLGNNVLSFDYNVSKTNINTVDNSLIKNFSNVETKSYRLAYEIHKDKHNTLGWSFSLPSHITSGTMDLEVAESVNLDGTINYTNIASDLTQTTMEKNIGFFYSHNAKHETDASFNFTAEYRQDIAGQNGKDGVNLGINYVKKFWGACGFLIWKNQKCLNPDGSQKNIQKLINDKADSPNHKHGLRYDLKLDMFVPIEK